MLTSEGQVMSLINQSILVLMLFGDNSFHITIASEAKKVKNKMPTDIPTLKHLIMNLTQF